MATAVAAPVDTQAITAEDQVSYYSFDDESGSDSWGSRDGVTDAVTYAEGIQGSALRVVDGEGMTFDEPIGIEEDDDWSVSYWVRADETPTDQVSVLMDAEKDFATSLKMASDRHAGFRVGKGGGDVLTFAYNEPSGFAGDTWYHIAWTQSKDVGLSMYVDGSQVGDANLWTARNRTLIPLDIVGGTGFTGEIDELKVYNRVLSANDVVTDLESTAPEGWGEEDPADPALPIANTIPEYQLPAANLSDVEKAPGTDRQYLGQPDLIQTETGRLISAFPIGHGKGPLIMKVSDDNGETWTEKTDIPESWAGSQETPTMFTLDMPDGSERLLLVTGNPGWGTDSAGYTTGWNTSYSDDNGETWTEYTHWHENHDDGSENNVIVAMSSLVQLKDDEGNFIPKWMGVYHDYDFINYKTYLTFDEAGNEQWSTPEPYLSEYRDIEALYLICELGMFRSPDGERIIGLARSQSHNNPATLIYSDDEGETWSEPMDLPGSLAGERHKPTYDPTSERLVIPFREIVYDLNGNGQFDGNPDWRAGNWVAWVGTYDQLMNQEVGEYRILLGEDWSANAKGGDTGYTGVVTQPDGTFIMHSYGHWDKEFSQSWQGGITTDLSWILQAKFSLCEFEEVHSLPTHASCTEPVDPIPGEFVSQRIALGGDGVFPNYRIPAVIQLNNGDILLSYDGRPTGTDSPGPNSILQRRSTDGGKTWGPQTVISQGKTTAPIEGYSDPSYVYDEETGTLFNFHVYSKNTGFWNSVPGQDDDNRDVMSTWLAVSEDNGETWEHRSLTAVAKPEEVAGTFASSGHGIQIKRGEHAGRLVQQYAGRFPGGEIKAYSLYSDDHGETWQMGEPIGVIMDENKVVELSDGTLMMNSRMHHTYNARWVAYSEDGGETWSEPEMDHTLIDPRNNASIIQMNPDAPADSAEAKELLFSNSANTSRTDGTVRYSCDNGDTWPVAKMYKPGAHSYSDLVALDDGTFGVFYEAENSEQVYGMFDREWLMPFCADFAGGEVEIDAGETVDFTVTLTNDDDVTLPAGIATLTVASGWATTPVDVPALEPGDSFDITIPVTAPIFAGGGSAIHGEITIEAGEYSIRGDAVFNVVEGADATLGAQIVGFPGDSERDVVTDPYVEGELLDYHFRIDSQSNVAQRIYPTAGDFYPFLPDDGPGNCRWMSLPPGNGYTCTGPNHTVTADELADGFFLPESTWAVEDMSDNGLEDLSLEIVGDPVSLRERLPELEIELANAEFADENGDGFAQAGETITYDVTVTNSGNVRLTDVDGTLSADALAVDESITEELSYVITDADIEAASAEISAVTASASNGELDVEASADGVTVQLVIEKEEEEPVEPVTGNVFFIANDWNSPQAELEIAFGEPGDIVFAGDWDGDGIDTLAIRRDTTFIVYNSLDDSDDAIRFKYGRTGDEVLVGDWDGDGTDTFGVRRDTTFYLNNALGGGNADIEFKYGRTGDEVLVGDWDGDATDTITVRRGHTYFVNDTLVGGNADIEFRYGRDGDEAFAGDFDGDGSDTISLRRGHTFFINNELLGGPAEHSINFGRTTDSILIGDWDGDGVDTPAANRVR